MKTIQNLKNFLPSLAIVAGFCVSGGIAISIESGALTAMLSQDPSNAIAKSIDQRQLAVSRPLLSVEFEMAKSAWAYFDRNLQPSGLVNSTDGFPSSTLWDQSSFFLGLVSAYRLGIVDRKEYLEIAEAALRGLSELELVADALPNKVYNTITLEMTDYEQKLTPDGIGWSALDLARLLVSLDILAKSPELTNAVDTLYQRWAFGQFVSDGLLLGSRPSADERAFEVVQEGRLGYEEYGSRAVSLVGLDSLQALRVDDFLEFVEIGPFEVAFDARDFQRTDANNYVVSEPYLLTAFEFGLDEVNKELGHRVLGAQEFRYRETGRLTSVSESNIDEAPYFLYYSVYANGETWVPLAENGEVFPDLAAFSTKAAIGWHMIYEDDYTQLLFDEALKTQTDEGFYSGIYEADGRINKVMTANTNGIILEALHYKQFGPMLTYGLLEGSG